MDGLLDLSSCMYKSSISFSYVYLQVDCGSSWTHPLSKRHSVTHSNSLPALKRLMNVKVCELSGSDYSIVQS